MSTPTCYGIDGNGIYNDSQYGAKPCGTNNQLGLSDPATGVQSCCMEDDECGANNICQVASNTSITYRRYGSGYYLGGCTDPTFESELCRNNCRIYSGDSDIVYVQNDIWACCGKTDDGSNQPNCSVPLLNQAYEIGWSAAEFPGPIDEPYSPAATTTITNLSATDPASGSVISAAINASVQTSGASSSDVAPMPATYVNEGGNVDMTAVGAGVGAGASVLSFAAGGFLLWRRRDRKAARSHNHMETSGHDNKPFLPEEELTPGYEETKGPAWSYHPVELPIQSTDPAELPVRKPLIEMPDQTPRLVELAAPSER